MRGMKAVSGGFSSSAGMCNVGSLRERASRHSCWESQRQVKKKSWICETNKSYKEQKRRWLTVILTWESIQADPSSTQVIKGRLSGKGIMMKQSQKRTNVRTRKKREEKLTCKSDRVITRSGTVSGAEVSMESLGVSVLEGIVREEGNENLTKQSVKFFIVQDKVSRITRIGATRNI